MSSSSSPSAAVDTTARHVGSSKSCPGRVEVVCEQPFGSSVISRIPCNGECEDDQLWPPRREPLFFKARFEIVPDGPPIPFDQWLAEPHPKTPAPPSAGERLSPTLTFVPSEEEMETAVELTPFQQQEIIRRKNKRLHFRALRDLAFNEGQAFVRRHQTTHLAAGFCSSDYRKLGEEFELGRRRETESQRQVGLEILGLPPTTPLKRAPERPTIEGDKVGRRCDNNCCDITPDGKKQRVDE